MSWLVRTWLPVAVAVTGVCLLVFVVAQQQYRNSLNDPQIRFAEDAAAKINAGAKPADIVPRSNIDISESLATWIGVFDAQGLPVISSGLLMNATPTPPVEVVLAVRQDPDFEGQYRVTWQPYSGQRQALVVVNTQKDYIVVAGRNTYETERRIWNMQATVGAAWILILAATLFASRIGTRERDSFTVR